VNRHRFDADPDPNVHFDADPNPDPEFHQNDADPRADPTPRLQMLEHQNFFTFSHSIASIKVSSV
jgi:hypothetical protein